MKYIYQSNSSESGDPLQQQYNRSRRRRAADYRTNANQYETPANSFLNHSTISGLANSHRSDYNNHSANTSESITRAIPAATTTRIRTNSSGVSDRGRINTSNVNSSTNSNDNSNSHSSSNCSGNSSSKSNSSSTSNISATRQINAAIDAINNGLLASKEHNNKYFNMKSGRDRYGNNNNNSSDVISPNSESSPSSRQPRTTNVEDPRDEPDDWVIHHSTTETQGKNRNRSNSGSIGSISGGSSSGDEGDREHDSDSFRSSRSGVNTPDSGTSSALKDSEYDMALAASSAGDEIEEIFQNDFFNTFFPYLRNKGTVSGQTKQDKKNR